MAKLPNYEHTRIQHLLKALQDRLNYTAVSVPNQEMSVESYMRAIEQLPVAFLEMQQALTLLKQTIDAIEVSDD